jgi:histidine ammonia-lyase
MLIRAHSLAQGYSGVRPLIIDTLIAMLNRGVYPAVPSKGSLGASGDLAPLSHLAMALRKVPAPSPQDDTCPMDTTDGLVFAPVDTPPHSEPDRIYHITSHHATGQQTLWRQVPAAEVMAQIGGQVELRAKEALALNNGTTFSTAIAALTLYDAWNALENAEVALALTLEAARGFRDSFFPQIHRARGHAGAIATAANVLRYVDGSALLDRGSQTENPERVPPQDPYSIRCAPQVIGAARDTLTFIQQIVDTELNAATDNPLIFADDPDLTREYKTVSGGNFHGEPVALAMDFLSIAVTELGSIAERRAYQLTHYTPAVPPKPHSGEGNPYELPKFLIRAGENQVGLNSGLMMLQYTAAALVSDCKTLAHPDSVDSIPSSANQEDHVSMSLNAARHAREIVTNVETVIAIEFLLAAQALDLRFEQAHAAGHSVRLGIGTEAVFRRIRDRAEADHVDYVAFDRALYPDIQTMLRLVRSGELVRLARAASA